MLNPWEQSKRFVDEVALSGGLGRRDGLEAILDRGVVVGRAGALAHDHIAA
jgi:hypothetical protein